MSNPQKYQMLNEKIKELWGTEHNFILDIETKTDLKTLRLVGLLDLRSGEYETEPCPCLIRPPWNDLKNCSVVTWNGARFDLPVLQDNGAITDCNHIDAMLLHKMLFPDSRHGLDAVGKEMLGERKKELSYCYDTVPLPELIEYCNQDLNLTANVLAAMLESPAFKAVPNAFVRALKMETAIAASTERCKRKGVMLDMEYAAEERKRFTTLMQCIQEDIEPNLPQQWPVAKSKLQHPPKVQFRKDGSPSSHIVKYLNKFGLTVDDVTLPIAEPLNAYEPLSLANMTGIKEHLLDIGWEPTEWNYKKDDRDKKTSPRLTNRITKEVCPNLEKLGVAWIEDFSEWLTLRSRRNVIESDNGTGWLPIARDREGTLPPDADTLGAATGRFAHKVVANVPRPSSKYGRPMREMLCARPGMVWVGWDADSLEAFIEAHYCYEYDQDYAKALTEGNSKEGTDVHTLNYKRLSFLSSRSQAKTFKYAITYGSQPKGLQATLGCTMAEAKTAFDEFWHNNYALAQVKERLTRQREQNKGYVQGLDGRMLYSRSPHSVVNLVFQNAGVTCMKYAALFAERDIGNVVAKAKAYPLIRYHDEEVWECAPLFADKVAELGEKSVTKAGEFLKLNVKLTASAEIGNNWADVH